MCVPIHLSVHHKSKLITYNIFKQLVEGWSIHLCFRICIHSVIIAPVYFPPSKVRTPGGLKLPAARWRVRRKAPDWAAGKALDSCWIDGVTKACMTVWLASTSHLALFLLYAAARREIYTSRHFHLCWCTVSRFQSSHYLSHPISHFLMVKISLYR